MYGKYGNPPANSPVFFTAICPACGTRPHPPPPPCPGTVHRRFRKTLESFASNYGKFCMKHWKDFQKPLGGSRGKHKRSGRTRLKPKLKIPFSFASASTFSYICHSEYRMRLGRIKFENFVFICLCAHLSLYLLCEYRMRLGKSKSENFVFICLCARLSLYLPIK